MKLLQENEVSSMVSRVVLRIDSLSFTNQMRIIKYKGVLNVPTKRGIPSIPD